MTSYKIGDFLYHQEYGVGRVQSVSEGPAADVEINFQRQGRVILSEHLVRRSTSRLSPEGFRAFAYIEPEQAKELLKEDAVEVVCRVLEDFARRRAKTEDLKDYLSPYVEDWSSWWSLAQPLLKESPRIDSTKSKIREYGVMQDALPPAQAAYQSFRRYRKYEDFPMVYDQARRVLRELAGGSTLADEEIEDLLAYFRQVIAADRYPISERVDAFFRLVNGNWLSPEQTREQIARLLQTQFRIYELEPFAQQRITEFLIQDSVDEIMLELIFSGMGAQSSVIQILHDWAVGKSDPSVIARLVIAGLSNNLPPDLVDDQYPALKARLKACIDLVKSIPLSSPYWPEIFTAFDHTGQAIGAVPNLNSIKIFLPELVSLAWELHIRALKVMSDADRILDTLVDPRLRIDYIVAILEATSQSSLPKEFSDQIEEQLVASAKERGDDFLSPLVSWRWKTQKEQVAGLVSFIEDFPGQVLIERAGRIVCEIGIQSKENELLEMLPFLDRFHRLPGTWTWRETLESLREKAILEMLHRKLDLTAASSYEDRALIEAVKQYLQFHLEVYRKEIQDKDIKVNRLQSQINELEVELDEKGAVLRELRGNIGGDSREARFEERSRIFKELVNTMAEFERFIASLPSRSKEIEGMLQRLENLASINKIIAQEPIGEQVPFNPQKHRLVGGSNVSPGEKVIVIEKGYLIRDNKDRLRLLKPALVKKP
jgi:molecular chaperone GrpE (heat shock protein)